MLCLAFIRICDLWLRSAQINFLLKYNKILLSDYLADAIFSLCFHTKLENEWITHLYQQIKCSNQTDRVLPDIGIHVNVSSDFLYVMDIHLNLNAIHFYSICFVSIHFEFNRIANVPKLIEFFVEIHSNANNLYPSNSNKSYEFVNIWWKYIFNMLFAYRVTSLCESSTNLVRVEHENFRKR